MIYKNNSHSTHSVIYSMMCCLVYTVRRTGKHLMPWSVCVQLFTYLIYTWPPQKFKVGNVNPLWWRCLHRALSQAVCAWKLRDLNLRSPTLNHPIISLEHLYKPSQHLGKLHCVFTMWPSLGQYLWCWKYLGQPVILFIIFTQERPKPGKLSRPSLTRSHH